MRTRGAIYHHKDMVFHNGGISNKYLILLNSPAKNDPYLFVKTTTQEKGKSKTKGCLKAESLYFIPGGTTFFPRDTWVQLFERYEIEPSRIDNNADIYHVGDLDHKTIDEIVNCLFLTQADDLPPIHKNLLRPPIEEYKLKLAEKFKVKK